MIRVSLNPKSRAASKKNRAARKAKAERNRRARGRRAEKRRQKWEAEGAALARKEAEAEAKAAQLAADLIEANLARRVLAYLKWEDDLALLLDALAGLIALHSNETNPEASAEAMKAKFGEIDDGLDIPECLRRDRVQP